MPTVRVTRELTNYFLSGGVRSGYSSPDHGHRGISGGHDRAGAGSRLAQRRTRCGSGAHISEPISPAHSLCADPSLDRPFDGAFSHCGQRTPSGTYCLPGQRILSHRLLAGSRRCDRDQSSHHDPQLLDL